MIDHSEGSPRYQAMTNLLSPSSLSSSSSSSASSLTTCSNHHDLHCPSSVYHQSSEVIVSPHRSSVLMHSNHQGKQRSQTMDQTDSDGDLDSSSSSSCITNSSKLKKRRANLPKDSVSAHWPMAPSPVNVLSSCLGSNLEKLVVRTSLQCLSDRRWKSESFPSSRSLHQSSV